MINPNGIVDYLTGSTTVYQGDSSYLEIFGTTLTAWGETPTPIVTSDAGLTINFVSYASDGQVNVSYTVAGDAAVGPHSITLQVASGTARGTVNVAPPIGIFQGMYNITGVPQTVTVGQQISLSVLSLKTQNGSVTNPSWSIIGGTWVGGFTESTGGGYVTGVTANAQLITFYLPAAGTVTITVSAAAGGAPVEVNTTYTAAQPNAAVGVGQQNTSAIVVDSACDILGYPLALHYGGCPGNTAGMTFTVTPDPNYPGSYEWDQLVISASATVNGTSILNCSGGLDNTDPYSAAAATKDSPLVAVSSLDTDYTVNETFQMFLMYKPNSAGAIFIPLAVVPWGWSAEVQSTDGWTNINYVSKSINGGGKYLPSSYPTWGSLCTSSSNQQ